MIDKGRPGRVVLCFLAAVCCLAISALAQTPQPFPRPGEQRPAMPAPAVPSSGPQQPPVAAPAVAQPSAASTETPTEATLGVGLYPRAEFVGSYDAGRGQRYYLFGSTTDFLQIVTYYRTLLKQKGELLFEEPPVHQFEIGRFREETMAFPPSVTIKDYTWGGSAGYLNPKRGAEPARFKTIIQIVPAPAIQ